MEIKNRKSGGRPVKTASEKLKYKVTVKLATEDYYNLKAKVKEAGISRSEFIRQCIRNSFVKQRLTIEQSDFIRKLCGMANNLNQIARKKNSYGFVNVKDEYNPLAEKIDNLITQIQDDGKDNEGQRI